MLTVLSIIGCALSLLAVGGLIVAVIVIVQSNQRDPVSGARQGWISRRSEQDEEGW
jgi:hypothetical protein